jgi:hypothetical protein
MPNINVKGKSHEKPKEPVRTSKTKQAIAPKDVKVMTPTEGSLFDIWIADFLTGSLLKVESQVPFDDAIDWYRLWMQEDKACSPIIIRCGYEVPKVFMQREPDPPPKSPEKLAPVRKKRSKPTKRRRSVKLLS